jgi:hypothetical protein
VRESIKNKQQAASGERQETKAKNKMQTRAELLDAALELLVGHFTFADEVTEGHFLRIEFGEVAHHVLVEGHNRKLNIRACALYNARHLMVVAVVMVVVVVLVVIK